MAVHQPINGKNKGVDISGQINSTFTSTTLANNDSISVFMVSNAECLITPTATSSVIKNGRSIQLSFPQ